MNRDPQYMDLRDYAQRLLVQKSFYSFQERNAFAAKLRVVLKRLKKIEKSLSSLDGVAEDGDSEIRRLIRQISNRIKVLPMEPIMSDVCGVAIKGKLRLPLLEV